MALPPVVCDTDCHSKRLKLYLFYTTFLGSLVLLALLHFIFFLSSRRKTKYEAREYATRKQEFVSGMPEILPTTEKDTPREKTSHPIEDESHHESNYETRDVVSPEPSTSAGSLSALNRILAVNGIGSVPLQRIDEECIVMPRDAMSNNNRGSSSSSCSATTLRDRTVMGALQEPVIVTVATVSALFQQHEVNEPMQQRSRSHSSESTSSGSVLDISDLIQTPNRSIERGEDAGNEEPKGSLGEWGVGGVERGLLTKHQMLDVRMGGGRGGYLKSHRGEQLRKGDAFSNDAIFPTSGATGIYDADHLA